MNDLVLESKTLPRDVKTRWNSTYRLLTMALNYREAVDTITANRRLGLRQLELSEEEWVMLDQLRDVLKVSRRSVGLHSVGCVCVYLLPFG